MSFQSYAFILAFLPVVVAGHRGLIVSRHEGLIPYWLLASSLVFVLLFNPLYVMILAGTGAVNFGFHIALLRCGKKCGKGFLAAGLTFNIGLLFYFKYYNFFIGSVNRVFGASFVLRHIILPLGISYYTFKSIALLMDSYRGDIGRWRFSECLLYLCFFPQVISGPIALPSQMFSQLRPQQTADRNEFSRCFASGLTIFILGLAKKIFFADTFGAAADWGYAQDPLTLTSLTALFVTLSYTLQIYFDFSGYSDMAKGIGLMLHINTPDNFNSPYQAFTVPDFWKRWHITLTAFLTRYLYIPLGGNRCGKARAYFNIMVVFLISGLWHGDNWTFIVWGLMHGMAQVVSKMFNQQIQRFHPAFNWICTFFFVNIAWVFFRADSLSAAVQLVKQIAKINFGLLPQAFLDCFVSAGSAALLGLFGMERFSFLMLPAFFAVAFVLILNFRNTNELAADFRPRPLIAVLLAMLLTWCIISLSGVTEFLYYNF